MEKGKGWGSGAWDCWSEESRMEWIGNVNFGRTERGRKESKGRKEKGRGVRERKGKDRKEVE